MEVMRLEWDIDDNDDLDDTRKDAGLLEVTVGLLEVPQDYDNMRDCLIKAMLRCLIDRGYKRSAIKRRFGEQAAEEQEEQEEEEVTE
jgi:hypothetical protein